MFEHRDSCTLTVSCLQIRSVAFAASQKIPGSIPFEIIVIFDCPNISDRTLALGSTQPNTNEWQEPSWGNGLPGRKADNLIAIYELIL
jgi:hypothetical protein